MHPAARCCVAAAAAGAHARCTRLLQVMVALVADKVGKDAGTVLAAMLAVERRNEVAVKVGCGRAAGRAGGGVAGAGWSVAAAPQQTAAALTTCVAAALATWGGRQRGRRQVGVCLEHAPGTSHSCRALTVSLSFSNAARRR